MKVRKPVIKDPNYCSYLFLLKDDQKNSHEISKYYNKRRQAVHIQLTDLWNKGFLSKHQPEKKLMNMKPFSVNYRKISEEFINYIKQRSKKSSFKINKKYSKNKYVQQLFKNMLSDSSEELIKKEYTLEDLFNVVSLMEISGNLDDTGTLKSKLDERAMQEEEFNEFVEFLSKISPANWMDESIVSRFDKSLTKIING